ncbi:M23 family metallopeptidase [Leptospira wolffii]|uniref:M23 family metallopeptidase n=1 Tax=Leptospira wolffii TaxID=409998 RepID=UPI0039F016DB
MKFTNNPAKDLKTNGLGKSKAIFKNGEMNNKSYNVVGWTNPAKKLDRPSTGSNPMVSSNYGNRMHPIKKIIQFHEGIDILELDDKGNNISAGAAVKAMGAGMVVRIEQNNAVRGNAVAIDYGDGRQVVSMHFDGISSNLQVGGFVNQNQLIGGQGKTGGVTGVHLHAEYKKDGALMNLNDLIKDDQKY